MFGTGAAGDTSRAPKPTSLMPSLATTTFCRYVPGRTTIVSPEWALSTAAWIESPGRTSSLESWPEAGDAGATSAKTASGTRKNRVKGAMAAPSEMDLWLIMRGLLALARGLDHHDVL